LAQIGHFSWTHCVSLMASDTVARGRRRFLSSVFGGGGIALCDFTVFIIDDDQGMLDALIRFPRTSGYETKAYSSPQAFLEEHDPSMPGCVVLNLSMPRMNELAVQRELVSGLIGQSARPPRLAASLLGQTGNSRQLVAAAEDREGELALHKLKRRSRRTSPARCSRTPKRRRRPRQNEH
jgi:CheY-like chemotaxis protein